MPRSSKPTFTPDRELSPAQIRFMALRRAAARLKSDKPLAEPSPTPSPTSTPTPAPSTETRDLDDIKNILSDEERRERLFKILKGQK